MFKVGGRFLIAGVLLGISTFPSWAGDRDILQNPPKNALAVPLTTISLEADLIGKPSPQFTYANTGVGPEGHWEVQLDPLVSARHVVLIQNGQAEAGNNVALALLKDFKLQNGEVAMRFRINSGENDQSAGIIWRYQDPQNYYFVRANAIEDSCSVYRVKKGVFKLLDTKQAVILPYTWHELRVVFVQKNYTVFVNGDLTVGGKDSSIGDAGMVGLCTLADSVVRFDRLRVSR